MAAGRRESIGWMELLGNRGEIQAPLLSQGSIQPAESWPSRSPPSTPHVIAENRQSAPCGMNIKVSIIKDDAGLRNDTIIPTVGFEGTF